jgi:hypothetical protein
MSNVSTPQLFLLTQFPLHKMMILCTLNMSQHDEGEIIVNELHEKISNSISATLPTNQGKNDTNVVRYHSQQSLIDKSNVSFVIPTEKDVLCGRGKAFFNHEGNKKFRQIIGNTIGTYLMAKRKSEKSKIVLAIAEEVMETGARFLKRKETEKEWYEGGLDLARQKVCITAM